MKRFALFVAVLSLLLPALAFAQQTGGTLSGTLLPVTVTLVQPTQPPSGQAYPGQTVAAVAVTVKSNALAHYSAIKVQKVGSTNNAAIVDLKVYDGANSVIGETNGFDANNVATIPVTGTTDSGESKTWLVTAVMASDLTAYAGQSFELNITGVTSDAVNTNGVLPIYGAQFTLTTGVAKPTCSISANTSTYNVGQTINISWTSTNATGGTITGIGSVGPKGLQGILPGGQTQTLVGTFTGPGGTGTCSLTLTLTTATGGVISPGGIDTTGGVNAAGSGTTVTPGASGGSNTPVSLGGSGAKAASNIIPCSGLDCRPCDIAALVQNLINYLIGLTIPLAAAMFAYAGILYFTSAANPTQTTKAKSVFKVVLWGFLIAIGGYIVVQLLLSTLLSGQYKSWNSIQCNAESSRPGIILPDGTNTTTNVGNFFSALGGINTNTPSPVAVYTGGSVTGSSGGANNYVAQNFTGGVGTCKSGYTYLSDAGVCSNADGTDFQDPSFSTVGGQTSGYSIGKDAMGQYLSSACDTYGANCTLASYIARNESSNGTNCTTSNTGAAGCMQVLATTACGIDSTISSDCGSCLASHNSISQQCSPVIQTIVNNPQMGVNLGVQYISQLSSQYGGDCQLTAAAYYQGPANVKKYGGVPPNAVSYVNRACGGQ